MSKFYTVPQQVDAWELPQPEGIPAFFRGLPSEIHEEISLSYIDGQPSWDHDWGHYSPGDFLVRDRRGNVAIIHRERFQREYAMAQAGHVPVVVNGMGTDFAAACGQSL